MSKLVKVIDTLESRLAGTSLGFRFNVHPVAETEAPKVAIVADNVGVDKKTATKLVPKATHLSKSPSVRSTTSAPTQQEGSNQNENTQNAHTIPAETTPAPVAEVELVAVLPTFLDEEIFSKKDSCLYLYLAGNCYR